MKKPSLSRSSQGVALADAGGGGSGGGLKSLMPPYSIRLMARVTTETVEAVARLARLELSDEERATFARQLDEILAYAETLQAIDTSAVEPMSHAGESSALREDTESPCLPRGRALLGAPDVADGLFRVPRVIGG